MNPPLIRVVISGPPKSGKSSAARIITKALADAGVAAEVVEVCVRSQDASAPEQRAA
jgi:tRNA uridine 5-carbamoylmethylation protein Kti12